MEISSNGNAGSASSTGSRWNSARKNRNHSRFLIRRRIEEEAESKTKSKSKSKTIISSSWSSSSSSTCAMEMNQSSQGQRQRQRQWQCQWQWQEQQEGRGVDNGVHDEEGKEEALLAKNGDEDDDDDGEEEGYDEANEEKENSKQQQEEEQQQQQERLALIKSSLKAISLGSTSHFSLELFSTQNKLLTEPLSTKVFFSTYKIQTLCYSRFDFQPPRLRLKASNMNSTYNSNYYYYTSIPKKHDPIHIGCNDNKGSSAASSSASSAASSSAASASAPFYTNSVLSYIQKVQYCTMFEYALLLGEYDVAQLFIKSGGINPCDLLYQYQFEIQNYVNDDNDDNDNNNNNNSITSGNGASNNELEKRLEHISALVMRKLVMDFVPTSLSVYIAKSIYEMRLWSIINVATDDDNDNNHNDCNCDCDCESDDDDNNNDNDNDTPPCLTEQKCHLCSLSIPCPEYWDTSSKNNIDNGSSINHDNTTTSAASATTTTTTTKSYRPLLTFPSCRHKFCEICLWENVVNNLDERVDGDVMRCPVCNRCQDEDQHEDEHDNISQYHRGTQEDYPTSKITTKSKTERECQPPSTRIIKINPKERREKSMQQYLKLPKDIQELKKLSKRSKKPKNILYRSWSTALQPPTIGKSRDVRMDKFLRYVDLNALHHCRSCLECGVDVNFVNEYHQSPLYIACWKNYVRLVELLLDWGADVGLRANGNMSVLDVAVENGHWEVAKVLEGKISSSSLSSSSSSSSSLRERIQAHTKDYNTSIGTNVSECSPQMTKLIQDENHPGNGAFYIDHVLDERTMAFMDTLFASIPIADATEVKKKKIDKNIPCSLRHYFCDAEGHLRKMIATRIQTVLLQHRNNNSSSNNNNNVDNQNAYVFPHMRFLNYNQKGGELLPHVDLTKIDPLSGRRSTHTFILYLCDCEFGGETAMLKKLSEDGPKAYHEIIEPAVQPRRGRILLFPHACPHQGMKVISTPKILLRGEVLLF